MIIKVFDLRKFLLKFLIAVAILGLLITGLMKFNKKILPVAAQQKLLPIYSVDTTERKAAITFDCAWGADDIPDILTTLDKENIKATFFVVGDWAKKNPDKVKMIAEKGHDIGNHSQTHPKIGSLSKDQIKKELQDCTNTIESITGIKSNLFRPPYGEYNNTVIEAAKELNYTTIQWDVDSLDWKPGISSDEILKRVSDNIRNGSILLFHNDTKHTADILSLLLQRLKAEGYDFVPVSKLIMKDNYYIDTDGRQKTK